MVGSGVLLDFLSVFLAHRHRPPGRVWIVDDRGELLADSARGAQPLKLTALLPGPLVSRSLPEIPGICPPVRLGNKWYVDVAVHPVPTEFVRPLRELVARLAGWDLPRLLMLAHSMGAYTAARLAAADACIEQVWVAPVTRTRDRFSTLYRGTNQRVLFAPPLAPAEEAACDALSSKDWNPVTVSGLRAILIPRDDAWVPPELQRAFVAAADVAVEELHCGRGHAVAGGWPEVLQKHMDRCAVA